MDKSEHQISTDRSSTNSEKEKEKIEKVFTGMIAEEIKL